MLARVLHAGRAIQPFPRVPGSYAAPDITGAISPQRAIPLVAEPPYPALITAPRGKRTKLPWKRNIDRTRRASFALLPG